ncbi:MAG: phosphomannomutase/phosphoglucomutase [candidate division KSB1 bacterium]|nr:phosphomannomutase/phosphoglucomutase [candidate division KSB1 bacterium]MDZ7391883.1 phosphomannomutase/phosphoglucomutase [candidate division KSB1 bacterium]
MVNEAIFREYDIRGVVAQDFDDATVEAVGRAIGTAMCERKISRISVGRDVRLTSEHLQEVLSSGLVSTGLEVIDIGVVPTPVQYFSIVHLNLGGGVMVTGSHNPIEYNGFKISVLEPEKGLISVYGKEIRQLAAIISQGAFARGKGRVIRQDVLPAYVRTLKDKLRFTRRLKVVVDAGNGTAGPIAVQLWEDLGMEVVPLYCEPDGRFPHHLPDPTVPKYVVDLQKTVLAQGADLGIGYDGDADRIGAIDEQGQIVFADRLLALFSKDVLSKRPGAPIVFDVKCSQALEEFILRHGGKPEMWKTGHSLLKARMKELHAPLAGEMSGHMFFADDYFGYDDALYASGRLMQLVANDGRPLSHIAAEIPHFFATPEIRVHCADKAKFQVVSQLVQRFKASYEVIDIDGARVKFGDGWGLVRASNTQPVLVLRFEARTPERLQEIIEVFKSALRDYPEVEFSDQDFAF